MAFFGYFDVRVLFSEQSHRSHTRGGREGGRLMLQVALYCRHNRPIHWVRLFAVVVGGETILPSQSDELLNDGVICSCSWHLVQGDPCFEKCMHRWMYCGDGIVVWKCFSNRQATGKH